MGGRGCIDASEPPPSSLVKEVVIAADRDPAGDMAANRAAEMFSKEGRRVGIIRPAAPYKDFNDELRELLP